MIKRRDDEVTYVMKTENLFSRTIDKAQMIRPFLVTGVLEKDYEGERTRDCFIGGLEDSMRDAAQVFSKNVAYREMDTFDLCGMKGQWRFSTMDAPQYADGHYYIMEKVGLMPVYTVLESEIEQTVTIRFNAKRICVFLNGETVLNNSDLHERKTERIYVFEHAQKPMFEEVQMKLSKGENRLVVLMGCVGRGTGMSFSMKLLGCDAPITARVPLSINEGERAEIAKSQMETYLVDDCWNTEETPRAHIGGVPLSGCTVSIQVFKSDKKGATGDKVTELLPVTQSNATLPADLPAGEYKVEFRWVLRDGTLLSKQEQTFAVIEIRKPLPGYENFGRRRQLMLEELASQGNPLALYRLGRYDEIPQERVFAMCDQVLKRADCADFELLPLLWLVWEDREDRRMSEVLHHRIREAAVKFRYWVDEPGTSSMFYCSENHRVGFHVCEYLAGLLYPTDMFTNCEQNGMYHSMKGRMHLMEWLEQRCRFGFDEPLSDSYLPVTLSALLVLREVLPWEEYPLRNMVNVLLDFMTFIFAAGSFDGVMATPRGRSYNRPLRSGYFSGIGGIFWMMFGNGPANKNALHDELAFSYYVPPKGLCALAEDFAPATFTYKQGLMHFDKHNADFTIRRTKDYVIGGTRDHNVGMCDMHFISAMIVLRGDVLIHFSAPNNMAEGSGLRPDYWAGQAFLPRVLMTGRTLAVIWHDVKDANIWMTHCHFNTRKFDEVFAKDGWTFGRKGDGYVAIHSTVPHTLNTQGNYAGRELVCPGNEVIWLAECGSQEEDGSFETFMERITTAQKWQDDKGYHFNSPQSGLIEFGLTEGYTVDHVDVPIEQYTAKNPYLTSRFGSGRFAYDCHGFKETHWTFPASE